MESILSIDAKNNPEILEDFEGMEPGNKVKIVLEGSISELSENRISIPLDAIQSVTSLESEGEEEDEDAEEEAEGEIS